MIKLLQKRFVITAMIAISLLIVMLLGAINIINIGIVRNDINRTLSMLAEAPLEPGTLNRIPDSPRPDMEFDFRSNNNRLLSAPYFIVEIDDNRNITYKKINNINSLDKTEIEELINDILPLSITTGKVGGYRYRITFNGVMNIVFLDTSNEIYSYLRVLLLSVGVGVICWTLMLILVMVLSKKAIRPIAENIEKQKEFITNAGHEIKTPLAIIQANTDAMELYSGENKWSKNIKQQVARLDGLMKNLLFLTRSDESGLIARKVYFSLSEVVHETANSFIEPLSLKGVQLQTSIQEKIEINGDKEQITQLISILLDNTLKYTDENGYVSLSLIKSNDFTHLQIKNTVAELPKIAPDKLFDRFYRGDLARTQTSGGYGIGLSMATAICEANNAEISANYEMEKVVAFNVKF